jgi:DTW domain-containing protein YfiP
LQVDVLMHHREQHRPSSTGKLITRVLPAARQFLWRRGERPSLEEIRLPDRELWILHPRGEPLPMGVSAESVQVLLLDGSWPETTAMAMDAGKWGRRVSLPALGESRYWLRDQTNLRRYSTVEALLQLLRLFRLQDAHDALRLQFELHVYATLRARGHKDRAKAYLAESPAKEAFADLLAQFDVRRPLEPGS